MSSHLPHHIPAGLSCPSCKYDLQGSTTLVCPECGCTVDPNAHRMMPPVRDPLLMLGVLATLFTICSSGYVAWLATRYALGFVKHDWGIISAWHSMQASAAQSINYKGLTALIPLLFILPLAGTCVTYFAGIGFRVARCCTFALIGYWILCCRSIG